MSNDKLASTPEQASDIKSPLSNTEAVQTTHQEARRELALFLDALGMQQRVSIDQLAFLLEHLIKEQTASDAAMIRDQMRAEHWEKNLSEGESLIEIAQRAAAYLATAEGIRLFNFFVKIFARTTPVMFLRELSLDGALPPR